MLLKSVKMAICGIILQAAILSLCCAAHISSKEVSYNIGNTLSLKRIQGFNAKESSSNLQIDDLIKSGYRDKTVSPFQPLDGARLTVVCPPSHYWNGYVCRLCDVCHDKEYQISMCSTTENTNCISHKEYMIGMRCLRLLYKTEDEEQFLHQKPVEGKSLKFLCSSRYSKLMMQLKTKRNRRSISDMTKPADRSSMKAATSTVSPSTPTSTPDYLGDDDRSFTFMSPTVYDKALQTPPRSHTPAITDGGSGRTIGGGRTNGGSNNGMVGVIGSVEKHTPGILPTSATKNKSSPSSDSASDFTWLYSLVAAVALILVVSFFVATRLHAWKSSTRRPDDKTSNNKNASNGAIDNGSIEMYDLNDSSRSCEEMKDMSKTSFTIDSSMKDAKSSSSNLYLDWLAKTSEMNAQNDYGSYHSEAETQTEMETLSHNSKTVFRTAWQFSGSFSAEGGILQRENSDVALVVGKDAVQSGEYVQINGAIFTDAAEIRRKFDLPPNEMLITPLVEYHADGAYQFQHHVSVKLPHALPEDFDVSHIKFYTFTVDECGTAKHQTLPLKSKDNSTADAYWEVSSQDECFIAKTSHFSGYFCTSCESKSKLPSIYARVFGSHIQIKSNRREIRLILYIWDRRLNIKDFIEAIMQQECDMDRQLLADEAVPLLDNATSDSSVVMRMETLGDSEDQQCWRHITRSNATRPLFRPQQVRKLRQIIMCCQQSDPIRIEWAMENVPDIFPSSVFQCLIEMVHVPEGVTNFEEAFQNANEEYIRTFYIRNLKLSKDSSVEQEPVSRQELVKRTMSQVMDRQEMESICQAFGINQKDIGNLSRKFNTEDALKAQLLEECCKKCGVDNFIHILPHILQQTHLYHVMQVLQAQDLLSTLSTLKSDTVSVGQKEYQGVACAGQTNTNSTVCKSLASCAAPPESRKQPSPNQDCNSHGFHRNWTNQNNPLRLNINLESNIDNETQVSPDSDYSSPSNRGGDSHACENYHQSEQLFSSSNNFESSSEFEDSCLANFDSDELQNVSSRDSTDSLLSGPNFEDSCLVNVDSQDLNDVERVDPLRDNREETSIKELSVLGNENSVNGAIGYPEIAEELCVSENGPGAMTKGNHCPTIGDNRSSDADEATYRKEMFV